jgi:hypothetical protein
LRLVVASILILGGIAITVLSKKPTVTTIDDLASD